MSRAVPQMNLLQVGFPVKIFVGLGILLLSAPYFMVLSRELFGDMSRDLMSILKAMT